MTRRELRAADKRARRRRRVPTVSTAMTLTVAISAALLGGGTAQAYSDLQFRSTQQHVAAAVALAFANRVRADDAAGARLDGVAVAFATVKRSEAVDQARAAVAQATSARASAAPDVTPETLTPLDEAMVTLTAMIAAAPAVVAPQPVAVPVLFALSATAPADDPFALQAEPTPATETSAGAAFATGAPTGPTAAPTAASTADPAGSEVGAETGTASAPGATAMAAVDLDVSAQLLVAAQLVTDLTVQVQAVAGANVAAAAQAAVEAATAAAEAAAQSAAAETARVLATSHRTELGRKVKAADAAPNGAIPADLLCGVSFDAAALLRCDAAQALEELAVAYRAEFGRNPGLASTYRSFSEQVAVRQSRGGLAATPGSSNHGRGQAVDFANFGSLGQFSAPAFLWMSKNAGEFGWHHPAIMEPGGGGPQEPWHWEFGTD
ncbi:MAG: M15 family metallopeptidase [Cellulomonas sp.]